MTNLDLWELLSFILIMGLPFPDFLLSISSEDPEDAIHYTRISTASSNMPSLAKPRKSLADEIIRPVASIEDLERCLKNPNVTLCRLTRPLEVEESIVINRDIVIDLGGYSINSQVKNIRVLDIMKGNVALIGSGSIVASNHGGVAVRIRGTDDPEIEKFSSITVGAEVMLQANNNDLSYGLIISPHHRVAYGVVVNFYGVIDAYNGIYINGNITSKKGNIPIINIDNGAAITAHADDGVAVYAAGYALWNINDATLAAGTSISVKSGRLNLDGPTVSATATSRQKTATIPRGAVILIEDNTVNMASVDIKIKDGIFVSQDGSVIQEYTNCHSKTSSLRALKISGGTFIAGGKRKVFQGLLDHDTTVISGGSFSSDVQDFVKSGLSLVDETATEDDGTVTHTWRIDNPDDVELMVKNHRKAKLESVKLSLARIALMNFDPPKQNQVRVYNLSDLETTESATMIETPAENSYVASVAENSVVATPDYSSSLVPLSPEPAKVDCTILVEMIKAAEGINQYNYTAESYAKLDKVIESAYIILEHSRSASQADVDAIIAAIALSTANLVERPQRNYQTVNFSTVHNYQEPYFSGLPAPRTTQTAQTVGDYRSNYNSSYRLPQDTKIESFANQVPPNPTTPPPSYSYNNYSNIYQAPPSNYEPISQDNFNAPIYRDEPELDYQVTPVNTLPVMTSPANNFAYNTSSQEFNLPRQNVAPTTPATSFASSQPAYPDDRQAISYPTPELESYTSRAVMSPAQAQQFASSSVMVNHSLKNYSSLMSVLQTAKEIDALDYTLSSFANLQQAIYAAEDIIGDPNATIEEFDAATFSLHSAISALEHEAPNYAPANYVPSYPAAGPYHYDTPLYY